jgi:hypothetical protein
MIKCKGSGSEEENADVLKQQFPFKDHLQEHVEYYGGRWQRLGSVCSYDFVRLWILVVVVDAEGMRETQKNWHRIDTRMSF